MFRNVFLLSDTRVRVGLLFGRLWLRSVECEERQDYDRVSVVGVITLIELEGEISKSRLSLPTVDSP